jgi:hypothetical protein
MRARAAGWPLLLLAMLLPAMATAGEPAIALLGIGGHGGERFAAQLERDLSDSYTVVSRGAYRRAVDRLGEHRAGLHAVKLVAERLHLTAVVAGAIAGNGRRRVLVLTVRSGASGRVTARLRYDLSGHTLPTLRRRVVDELVRAVAGMLPRPAAVAGGNKATTRATAGKAALAGGKPAPGAATTATSGKPAAANEGSALQEPDVAVAPVVAGDPEPADTPVKPEPSAPVSNAVFAAVGITLTRRMLQFDVAAAPGYRGTPVVGIRAEGMIFPIALSAELAEAHPVLASFAVAGAYEQLFSFSSSTPTARAVGYESRWSLLVIGNVPLGHGARGGTLAIESGFQRLSWGSQSPAQLRVPDVAYDMVDVGVGWRRPLGTKRLALSLRAAFLGLVDAGAIADPTQYGRARGWGVEGQVGLTVIPTRWLWIYLGGRYTPVLLSFAAAGTRFAHSATDQWLSGALEVGFAL